MAVCLARAWAGGAGPGDARLVVDVDSFVGEVYGYDKQGAGYGYTHKLVLCYVCHSVCAAG
jgi:hypothetical protein